MPLLPLSTRFGITVRKRRIKAGITQEILAERAGLHATYVGMVERGVRNPTLDVAAQFAKALGVELPILISESLSEGGAKRRRL